MFNEWQRLEGLDGDPCAPYLSQIYAAADKYGIDRTVAVNQLRQESSCNPNAISRVGAGGFAQFMSSTWQQWGSANPADRFNVGAALDAWGAYMRDLLDTNGGDYRLALAAYNSGQGNVDKYGDVPPFKETQNYVARILGALGIGTASAPDPSPSSPTMGPDSSGPASSVDTGSGVDLISGVPGWMLIAGLGLAAWALLGR